MAQVVFAVDLDEATLEGLRELRERRKAAILAQLQEIEETLDSLERMGALRSSERAAYAPKVQTELEARLALLDKRIGEPSVFYDDEIEYYLNLLSGQ